MNNNKSKHNYLLKILVVSWLIIGVQNTSYGDVIPVNERTQQIQDAIVAAIPDATTANEVTETHLASITVLNLRAKGITELKTGDFSGLTGLTNLNLYNNLLSNLPNGIFEGLIALTTLRLGSNTVDPMPIIVRLVENQDGEYKVVIHTGAPFEITFPINVTNDGVTSEATSVTIPTGNLESDLFTISNADDSSETQTIKIGILPELPRNHYGYTLARSTACLRSPRVRRAIVNAVPGVNDCKNVTDAHLTAIHTLNLEYAGITTLRSDDFSGLTSLKALYLGNNHLTTLPEDIFSNLSNLTDLYIQNNKLDTLPENVFSGLSSIRQLNLHNNLLTTLPKDLFSGLQSLTQIFLNDNTLTTLDAEIFSNVPNLQYLYLNYNRLTTLPESLFSNTKSLERLLLNNNRLGSLPPRLFQGMSTPTTLWIHVNRILNLPLTISLEKVLEGEFKVVVPAGTPIDLDLRITVRNGSHNLESNILTITAGSVESESITVTQTEGSSDAVTVDFDIITERPDFHFGYELVKSDDLPLEVISKPNVAPIFTAGTSTTRTVAENTPANVNIGTAIIAIDDNNDHLTYTLGGTDPESFDIEGTTGQLKTKASLDFETKSTYSITVSVSDGSLTDMISVSIHITDIDETIPNRAPSFTEGVNTTRTVEENTISNENIGTAIAAIDPDANTLVYSLGGTDADSFDIEGATGQLKTKAALNYETKNAYSISVIVTDSRLTDTINVTINISDVNEAPIFTEGGSTTRIVEENTLEGVEIGTAVSATDPDDDTLTYTLGGMDGAIFQVEDTTGQLKTKTTLDFETQSTYKVTLTVSDEELTDTIDVTITVTDIDEAIPNRAPIFTEGENTTRTVEENSVAGANIGSPVEATDADEDTLTYSLGGTDGDSFEIERSTGQLKTKSSLDRESQSTYTVSITVSDGDLTDVIVVNINVSNVNEEPEFIEGESTTRTVAENTSEGVEIGTAVSATDPDDDTLTYTLGGVDGAIFQVEDTTGQLKTKTNLDFETQSTYKVTLTVSDRALSDTIDVTITVTDIDEAIPNRAPIFTEGENTTRSVSENTEASVNIGSVVAATDPDGNTLIYTLGGTDVASFAIEAATGQLKTKTALDYETKNTYTISVSVTDVNLTDTINVTINVTDVNEEPMFTEGNTATRSVTENTETGVSIGLPVSATDPDENTLTYSITDTDSESFDIDTSTGQLKTKVSLDYETKNSYAITITVSDGSLMDNIEILIVITDVDETIPNRAPVFSDGSSTTLSIAENTDPGSSIGEPVSATDPDENTLVYTLGGTDSSSFEIESATGQLKTKDALDYETKNTYIFTINVSDGDLTDTIDVTVNVSNVNEAPIFTEGGSASRTVAENVAVDVNVGAAVSATDVDGNTLEYSLSGTDSASFDIEPSNGQLKTKGSLDHETKDFYTITVLVSDGNLIDTIIVTINISDVNEAPVFSDGESTSRSVVENTVADLNIGTAISATDVDDDTLSYTLGGIDAGSFDIVRSTGQLKTNTPLDYEDKNTYAVTITVSDGNLLDSIDVAISINDINEAPVFTDGNEATRFILENTNSGENIGQPILATDVDNDTLTYTLIGTDAGSFNINTATGQLKTSSPLDYESKSTYSVTVTVSDEENATNIISVTITVTDRKEPPVFTEGETTTRAVAENTGAGQEIGTPVSATDDDNDTLEYALSGTDVSSFSIDNTTGQLKTRVELDYESKNSYSVTISVHDGKGGTDSISVIINVTDIDEDTSRPAFTNVCDRTPQVRDAIVEAAGVNDCSEVTQEHLAAIDFFYIDNKSITSLKAGDFDGMSSMNTLSLTGNQLTGLPEDIFDQSPRLATIKLNQNQISNLPEDVFEGLSALNDIWLQENQLVNLQEDLFDGLSALNYLYLTSNKLTGLPEDIFDGLPSLKILGIGFNQIASLQEVVFDGLSALISLHIGSNKLSSIPSDVFDGLSALTSLNISSNQFSSVSDDQFDDLSSLTELYMGDNELTSLHVDIFDNLSSLKNLHLQSNRFTNTSLPEDVFDDLPALELLYLQGNKFSSLPVDIFEGLSSLKYLDLNSNEFETINEDLFEGLNSLIRLELQLNSLTSIPEDLLDGLSSLTDIRLHKNELTSLSAEIFSGLSTLEEIRLYNNKLTSLPTGIFSGLSSLTEVLLENNAAIPILFSVSLEKVGENQFKAVMPIGASYAVVLPISGTNGSISEGVTSISIPTGSNESSVYTITRSSGSTEAVSVNIGTLPSIPDNHNGYVLVKSSDLPLEVFSSSNGAPVLTTNVTNSAPTETTLLSNYPNPFNPETWIPYQLAKPEEVTVSIYNIRGKMIRRLRIGLQPVGVYFSRNRALHWDGRNNFGEKVATGLYFYKFEAGDYTTTRKMLIQK